MPEEVIERSYALLNVFEARAAIEEAAVVAGELPAMAEVAAGAAVERTVEAETEATLEKAGNPAAGAVFTEQVANSTGAATVAEETANSAGGASVAAASQMAAGNPAADAAGADYVQLSLFAEGGEVRDPHGSRKTDARLQQMADRLKQADLINMTPLAAMNFLFELKQRLSDKA